MKTNVLTTILCAAGAALLTVPGLSLATGNNLSLDLKSVEGSWAIAEYRMADQREREGALSVIAVHAATGRFDDFEWTQLDVHLVQPGR